MKNILFWGLKANPVALTSIMKGLEINKLHFSIKKIANFLLSFKFFFNFWSSKSWIRIRNRIGIQPKMLDPDPESMNQNTIRTISYRRC